MTDYIRRSCQIYFFRAKDCYFLGFDAVWTCKILSAFQKARCLYYQPRRWKQLSSQKWCLCYVECWRVL